MKIIVTKDTVKIEEFDLVHEGEHKVNKCSFSFSAEYTKELVKKAIFTSQNSSVEVAIINNECDIPTEILRARNIVLLGVYAYKVTEDKLDLRYSPSPDAFKVNDGSYIEGASDSEEITSSQFEQYMQALNDGLNKVEESLKKMDSATSSANDLVDNINQKLENGELIGPQGPQGIPGKNGTDGADGADGVGITTITSGQSSVEEDKTVTPVTVNKTDGSSQIFNVEAKNGIDGQNGKDGTNGQDGITPTIGENGNWYLGETDTGKPSRGETGSTPDLSDYVKNTDYATVDKTGVIKARNFFRVSTTGDTYVESMGKEMYKNAEDTSFISKGTLENNKNDYVGSSTPVQDLTSTVTNIQEEQDESKPKNTASGEMITVDDAIAYKTFNVTVDGASEQETTTGKNLLPYPYVDTTKTENGITFTDNGDGTITVNGTATAGVFFKVFATQTNQEEIPGNYISGSTQGCNIVVAHKQETTYTSLGISSNGSSSLINKETYATGYIELSILQGTTLNNVIIKPMLTLEQDTSYEPYTGGQPSPSPDYPQEITTLTFNKITRCGKNLIPYPYTNTSIVYKGITFTDNGDGSITANGTATGDAYFDVMGNARNKYKLIGNYITGGNKDISLNVTTKNEDGNYVVLGTSWDDSNSVAINKSVYDIGYIGLRIASGTTVNNVTVRPMMTMEPDTDYEPYQGQTYDIDLQGNEMVELPNGVRNKFMVDKEGNVSLIKNIGKVILDGSENNWDWNMITEDEKYRFSTGVIQSLVEPSTPCLSNYFMSGSADDGDYFVENTIEIAPSGGITICTYAVSNSIEEFRAWLQEHNVIVYYQLATPEVIPLGNLTDLITTEEGINNFFINGNLETTLEVLYALDIKKYIDNKLAEIASAMIEEG